MTKNGIACGVVIRTLLSGAIVLAASTRVAAGDGLLNTPLKPFVDGKLGRHVWTVPGVIKRGNFSTDFMCTSLEAPGVVIDIGVEIFDNLGNQMNDIGAGLACAAGAGNGSILDVLPGSTVTIGTSATNQVHEDCALGIGLVANGSARIISSSTRIACNAVVVDSKHVVYDPATGITLPPPPLASLHVIKSRKQLGD